VTAGAYLVGKDKKQLVQMFDWWARSVFLVLFLVVLLGSWWG